MKKNQGSKVKPHAPIRTQPENKIFPPTPTPNADATGTRKTSPVLAGWDGNDPAAVNHQDRESRGATARSGTRRWPPSHGDHAHPPRPGRVTRAARTRQSADDMTGDTVQLKRVSRLQDQLKAKNRLVLAVGVIGVFAGVLVGACGADSLAYSDGFHAGRNSAWSTCYGGSHE